MAEKEINAIVKNVTKTTDEWASATGIPAKGVICIETTTDGDTKIKIGDGTNAFSGLKYIDCGNADTLEGLRANEIACNPNLLMNPDFRINQRGLAEYSSGYTADRWYLASGKGTAAIENDGLRLSSSSAVTSNTHAFWQDFEFPLPLGKYTLSLNVPEVTGVWSARIRIVNSSGDYVASYYTPTIKAGLNTVTVELTDGEYISAVSVGINKGTNAGDSVKLNWIKLEKCGFATGFVPHDYAAELAKCQRFYQIRSTNDIAPVDLRPSMRAVTDIKAVEGGYAYVAEL